MDAKEAKNVWIGIVVIALIVGAYYFGATSKNSNVITTPLPSSSIVTEQPTKIPQTKSETTQSNNVVTSNQSAILAAKAQCAKYMEQEQKEAQDVFPAQLLSIYRIFYSPIRTSCVVLKYSLNGNSVDGELLKIADILDNTTIWQQYYPNAMKYWEAQGILDNQVKVLGLEN